MTDGDNREGPGPSSVSAASLARSGGHGALSVVAFSVLLNLLSLVSSLVLARQLMPEQYGAFAVGATVVGFARMLGDGGAGLALIQQPGRVDADDKDLGRVVTLQGLIAAVAAISLIAAAPFIRKAFDAPPETVWIIVVLAVTLVIEVPAVVPKVRLNRQQRYRRLQALSAVSFLSLYTVQIGGLVAGLELHALIAGQVVYSVVYSAVMVRHGGGVVRPVWDGLSALVRRGLPYQATPVVYALLSIGSIAVVGSQLTTGELGLWTWSTVLAAPLISFSVNLRSVVFSALSRLHEHHSDRHAEAVSLVARVQFLFVAAVVGSLCGMAEPLVRHLYDPKWLGAVGAVRAALIGVLATVLANLLAAGLESRGQPHLRLRATAVSAAVGVAAALPLSASFRTTGAAAATYLLVPLVDTLVLLYFARVGIRRALLNALVVGSGSFAVALALSRSVDGLVDLLTMSALAGALALFLTPLVDPGAMRMLWGLLRRRRRSSA